MIIQIYKNQLEDANKLIAPLIAKTGYKYGNTFKPKGETFEERYNNLVSNYEKLIATLDSIENPDAYRVEYTQQVKGALAHIKANCIKFQEEPNNLLTAMVHFYCMAKEDESKITRDGYHYLFLDLIFLYKLENEEIIFEIVDDNSLLGSGEKEIES